MAGVYSNIKSRAATALIIAAIVLLPSIYGGWLFAIMVGVIGARIAYEWVRMSDPKATIAAYLITIGGLLATVWAYYFGYSRAALVIIALTAILAIGERARRGGIGWAGFGVIYILLPSLAMMFIRGAENWWDNPGFKQFLFVVLVVVAADVGAYLGGSRFKGPKMAPKLSPNKTWSGFFSGVAFAALIGLIVFFAYGYPPLWGLILAIPVAIMGVIGDFLESGLKRRLNIKDTGGILPGHGGALDRLDALIAAMAVFAAIILINQNIWPPLA